MYLDAVLAGGSRIHKQHLTLVLVTPYFQYMRMSADKNIGRIVLHLLSNGKTIASQYAPDMGHPDIDSLPLKTLVKRIFQPNIPPVNIAVDPCQGTNGLELISNSQGPEVAGMPNFIPVLEVFCNLRVEIAVSVRN